VDEEFKGAVCVLLVECRGTGQREHFGDIGSGSLESAGEKIKIKINKLSKTLLVK
jgi:hypothetical protein